MAQLDAPAWERAAVAAEEMASTPLGEAEAKAAWLAKLDAPTWGAAAQVLSPRSRRRRRCVSWRTTAGGVDTACDQLSYEDEAARVARTWTFFDGAAAAVTSVAADVRPTEEQARRRGSQSSTRPLGEPRRPDDPRPRRAARGRCSVVRSRRRGRVRHMNQEDEAKKAWLNRLDAPAQAAAAASEIAEMQRIEEDCIAGDDVAWETLSREGEAKASWLAKLDSDTWGKTASALETVVSEASGMKQMEDDCNVGIEEACDQLSREDEAKRAWLNRLDTPTWGTAAAAVTEVAKGVVTPTTVASPQPTSAAGMSAKTIRDGLTSLAYLRRNGKISEEAYGLKKAFFLKELYKFDTNAAASVLEETLKAEGKIGAGLEMGSRPKKLRDGLISLRFLRDKGQISPDVHDAKKTLLLRRLAFDGIDATQRIVPPLSPQAPVSAPGPQKADADASYVAPAPVGMAPMPPMPVGSAPKPPGGAAPMPFAAASVPAAAAAPSPVGRARGGGPRGGGPRGGGARHCRHLLIRARHLFAVEAADGGRGAVSRRIRGEARLPPARARFPWTRADTLRAAPRMNF